jgi:two-component system response regulator ResD
MPSAGSILVIDDDALTCDMLHEVLNSEGYVVQGVATGADGLARIGAGGIDLVLLDLWLPDMDGLELCRRVRARADAPHLPIIMLTAVGDEERHRQASLTAGADAYVSKPFRIDALLGCIRTWMQPPERWMDADEQPVPQ